MMDQNLPFGLAAHLGSQSVILLSQCENLSSYHSGCRDPVGQTHGQQNTLHTAA